MKTIGEFPDVISTYKDSTKPEAICIREDSRTIKRFLDILNLGCSIKEILPFATEIKEEGDSTLLYIKGTQEDIQDVLTAGRINAGLLD